MTETRTANGDLAFTPRPDALGQARNNLLRYWEDRVNRGLAHPVPADLRQVPALMAAVRQMIETIDKEVSA